MGKESQEHFDNFMRGNMKIMDNALNSRAPRKVGIVILTFPYGEKPSARCNYISNGASRADMAVLFREMAARFEGQAEASGNA